MSHFKVDFFELMFLCETCIPDVPIARSVFWKKMINEHYHLMSHDERERAFIWITENNRFNKSNEDCQWFYARFNPDNQHDVTIRGLGVTDSILTFLKDERYYTEINKWIDPHIIISAEKIKQK